MTSNETEKTPDDWKEDNKLYRAMTNNINSKDQCNDAIEYELKFNF